jgi:hypothetical protein
MAQAHCSGIGICKAIAPATLLAVVAIVLTAVTESATAQSTLLIPRTGYTATVLASGKVLIIGGVTGDPALEQSTEIYDPVANSSSPCPDTLYVHTDYSATLLLDGNVLVIDRKPVLGGDGVLYAELYDPVANAWTSVAKPPILVGDVSAYDDLRRTVTLLADGRVLVLSGGAINFPGGSYFEYIIPSAHIYDPVADNWIQVTQWSAESHTATLLPSGKVLVAGGSAFFYDYSRAPGSGLTNCIGSTACGETARAGLYDPATDTWQKAASMPAPRTGHKAIALPNGKVLIEGGGYVSSDGAANWLPPVLYDIATDSWTWQRSTVTSKYPTSILTPTPQRLRTSLVRDTSDLVLLPSGEPLMLNGMPDTPATALAASTTIGNYFYDPLTNAWSLTAKSAYAGSGNPAAVLPSGKVFLTNMGEVELYDPHAAPPADPPTVPVVEFYNAQLDHYFISSLADDIYRLDDGSLSGWMRTGQTFNAYDVAVPGSGTSSVCRFYIPPANGDSHFFSASATECAETRAKFPTLVLESSNVMYDGLPDESTGSCPSGWTPVYRVWNNRADSNHRYTTDHATRDQMVAMGGIAEGYGPDVVSMCAPQ